MKTQGLPLLLENDMHLDMLEDIEKARKAKGLDSWKKLEYLREKLEGKQASQIERKSGV